jgi:hypothetical protein
VLAWLIPSWRTIGKGIQAILDGSSDFQQSILDGSSDFQLI